MIVSYNLFYIVFFVSASFLYISIFVKRYFKEHSKVNDVLGIILICLFSVWASLRPFTVPDTSNYLGIFNVLDKISFTFEGIFSRVKIVDSEFGFSYITKYLREQGISFRLYLFIMAIIINITTVIGIKFICEYIDKKHKYDYFTVFVLFLIFLGLHNFNVALRAGLSIGFGLFAIGIYLKYEKLLISCLFIILSMLFQSMGIAFILILLSIILPIKFKKKHFIIIWCVSIALVVLRLPGFLALYIVKLLGLLTSIIGVSAFNQYLEATVGGGSVPINIIFRVFTLGFITWIAYRNDKRYAKIALIVSLGIFAQAICYPLEGLYRVMEYFFMFIIPIIAIDIKNSRKGLVKKDLEYLLYYVFLIMQIRLCYSPDEVGQENVFYLIT